MSIKRNAVRWVCEGPGAYRTEDKTLWIIRTKHDGPNGGSVVRWELARPDEYGGRVINGEVSEPRLRDAKLRVERLIREGSEVTA